jgi:hypothetical protein
VNASKLNMREISSEDSSAWDVPRVECQVVVLVGSGGYPAIRILFCLKGIRGRWVDVPARHSVRIGELNSEERDTKRLDGDNLLVLVPASLRRPGRR